MKMNKILLSAALLISANAFAMEQTATEAVKTVKTSLFNRFKNTASQLWTNGSNKVATAAKYAWSKCPSMPASVRTKLANAGSFTAGKCTAASNWVVAKTPAVVKALTSRNAKIAGATLATAATVACAYLFRGKLLELSKQLLSKFAKHEAVKEVAAKN